MTKKLTTEEKRKKARDRKRAYRAAKKEADKDYGKKEAEAQRKRYYEKNPDAKKHQRLSKYRDPYNSGGKKKKIKAETVGVYKELEEIMTDKEFIELEALLKGGKGLDDTRVAELLLSLKNSMAEPKESKSGGRSVKTKKTAVKITEPKMIAVAAPKTKNADDRIDCHYCKKNLKKSYLKKHIQRFHIADKVKKD